MSTIGISLPDDLKRFLEEQVARRGFKDASEFVGSLLEAEKQRNGRAEVDRWLREAVDGPFEDWTDEDVDDIRRAGREVIRRQAGAR